MMISTLGNGSCTSSILPCRRVIFAVIPFASTISLAFSIMVDMSTPMTCFAPALTANLENQVGAVVSAFAFRGEHKHAENSSATSNIQHDLVLEQVSILVYGVAVAPRSDLIFEHLLVDAVMVVRVEVVRLRVRHSFHG